MAALPWPVYLLGSAIVLVGFGFLHRWLRGLTGRAGQPPPFVLAASVLAFLLGSGTLALAIVLDSEFQRENTRVFVYSVSVEFSGPSVVHLFLPAPEDNRLWNVLNRTNGTSRMRVEFSAGRPLVVVDARGNVSFFTQVQFVGPALNTNLTRLTSEAGASGNLNATIGLDDGDPGASEALVRLDIRFLEPCHNLVVSLEATVSEGEAVYPIQRTLEVC